MAQQEKYPEMRAPKTSKPLSVHAVEFVPKSKLIEPLPYYLQPKDGDYHQPQMPIHQSSHLHQRFATAQGGVEQGGGDGSGGGGGGGGGYEYTQMPHHLAGTSNGPMMANGSDAGKMSALQNRLSNMQIVDSGDNGKEFNHHHQQQHHHHHHHHHNQQSSMHHQHHQQQHRGQQHPGGHHGYHHHQQQQQQQHQPYVYEIGYPNNHHVQQGGAGMGGDHRKYNNGGQQHQQQYQHHRSRQQHHHHQQPHQQRQQHQQQYGGNHHHDYMDGGDPAGYNMVAPNWDSNFQEDPNQISYRQTAVMDYLTEVIAELLDNPGMFDTVQKQLPVKLGELCKDHYVMSSTIEMIFEQSIRESNFRYMGARMCQLLDTLDCGPDISVQLLLQLKMEHQNRELQQFMSQEQIKVRGATLFLAELYMQLRNPQVRNCHEMQPFDKIISEHIISAIEILLGKEGPENIKCVCQCLKLCGYELEQDCREKLESILKKLQSLNAVQSSTEAMIRSVIELRKNSWGRSEEIAPAAAAPMSGAEYQNGPVFYGPDGKMLTEEESSFLATNIESTGGQNAYSSYDDDDEFGMVDPDDDLEVQEAFVQFIQSNAQNRLQQPAVRYRPDV